MKYDLCIFDLDGTAFDTSPGIIHCVKEILGGMGYPIPAPEVIKTFIGPPLYEGFKDVCGVPHEDALIASQRYMALYKEVGYRYATPYDGFEELLRAVVDAGGENAIATLKEQSYLHHMMEFYGLAHYFKDISGSNDDMGIYSKGDVIRHCLSKTGVDPSRCVMIGDSGYDGVGAKECGMDFIAVTYGFGFSSRAKAAEYESVFIADNTKEVQRFLLRS